jgi:hypothetical protein
VGQNLILVTDGTSKQNILYILNTSLSEDADGNVIRVPALETLWNNIQADNKAASVTYNQAMNAGLNALSGTPEDKEAALDLLKGLDLTKLSAAEKENVNTLIAQLTATDGTTSGDADTVAQTLVDAYDAYDKANADDSTATDEEKAEALDNLLTALAAYSAIDAAEITDADLAADAAAVNKALVGTDDTDVTSGPAYEAVQAVSGETGSLIALASGEDALTTLPDIQTAYDLLHSLTQAQIDYAMAVLTAEKAAAEDAGEDYDGATADDVTNAVTAIETAYTENQAILEAAQQLVDLYQDYAQYLNDAGDAVENPANTSKATKALNALADYYDTLTTEQKAALTDENNGFSEDIETGDDQVSAFPINSALTAAAAQSEKNDAAKDKDGYLDGLVVAEGKTGAAKLYPTFSATTYEYTLTVASDDEDVSEDYVTVSGGGSEGGNATAELNDAGDKITITTENAQNNGENKTYTITIVTADNSAVLAVNNEDSTVALSEDSDNIYGVAADTTVGDLKDLLVLKIGDDVTTKGTIKFINPVTGKEITNNATLATNVKVVVTTEFGTKTVYTVTIEEASADEAQGG